MATFTTPKDNPKYVDKDSNDKNKFVDDVTGKYLSIFGEKKWYYTQVTVVTNINSTNNVVVGGQAF